LEKLQDNLTEFLSSILLGERIPLDISNRESGKITIPANRKITKILPRRIAPCFDALEIPASRMTNRILEIIDSYRQKFVDRENARLQRIESIEAGNMAESGVIKNVNISAPNKRKIHVGDKMAGRHGNKGMVSKVVHRGDMPFLPDGRSADFILNAGGVPSRMIVGRVLETHLRWGTGERFDQEIIVGYMYMMKLNHLLADKIHARAVGPYSLVTSQSLGGEAQ
jgi:DNA-directed RNA polymerase subunit beta